MADYPSITEAEKILQECIDFREKLYNSIINPTYKIHSRAVAEFARKLALSAGMDGEKAYALGLLHDSGKRYREAKNNKFHGQDGYEFLMEKGYAKSAQICLSHTFPNKDFNPGEMGYPIEWMVKAKELLANLEYDDYDRLIQLCDKLSDGDAKTTIEGRAKLIRDRYSNYDSDVYNMTEERYEALLAEGYKLKTYFDKLCGKDVYETLGIKNSLS